jgi:pilus assembly protein CpaB
MKTARIVVLFIAIAAGGGAAFPAFRLEVPPLAAAQPVASIAIVEVLVALSNINVGQSISAADKGWAAWPTEFANPL